MSFGDYQDLIKGAERPTLPPRLTYRLRLFAERIIGPVEAASRDDMPLFKAYCGEWAAQMLYVPFCIGMIWVGSQLPSWSDVVAGWSPTEIQLASIGLILFGTFCTVFVVRQMGRLMAGGDYIDGLLLATLSPAQFCAAFSFLAVVSVLFLELVGVLDGTNSDPLRVVTVPTLLLGVSFFAHRCRMGLMAGRRSTLPVETRTRWRIVALAAVLVAAGTPWAIMYMPTWDETIAVFEAGEPAYHKESGSPPPSMDNYRTIPADEDNQCHIEAVVNGVRFRFLMDSGADRVFFTIADAQRLGFDPARLHFDHSYVQWGGQVKGADVRLRSIRIGSFVATDVDAAIDSTDYDEPLLGANVLKQLHFQVTDGACKVSW